MKIGNFTSLNEVVGNFIEASTSFSSVFSYKCRSSTNPSGRNRGFNNYRGRGHGITILIIIITITLIMAEAEVKIITIEIKQAVHNRGRVSLIQGVSENEFSPQNAGTRLEKRKIENKSIFHINLNLSSFIEIHISSNNNLNKFLVDTGPNVSLIKIQHKKRNQNT